MGDDFDFDSVYEDSPKYREGYVKAPFGWPGGKANSIKEIIPHLPIRGKYIEECGGSGAILLAREESKFETFNDRFSGITDFYRCIQSPKLRDQLLEALQPVIHSREMFSRSKDWKTESDPVLRAAKWYYMVNMSFSYKGTSFGRAVSDTNAIAIKYVNKLPLIAKVSQRLQRVLIENQDMFQMFDDFDSYDAVHYWDPPYYDVSIGFYDFELGTREEQRSTHIKICERAMNTKGFVAVSSYPNDIYDSYDWSHVETWEVIVSSEGLSKDNINGRRLQLEALYIKDNL